MTQPLGEGASFGKLLCLSLEVDHVDRPPLKHGAACDRPTRTRESQADIDRKWSPVRGSSAERRVYPVEVDGTTFDLMERFGGLKDSKIGDQQAIATALGKLLRRGLEALLREEAASRH